MSDSRLEAYYGLPEKVVYCKRCVMSNQRPSSYPEFKHTKDRITPTLHIGEDFVCDACRYAEKKEIPPHQPELPFINQVRNDGETVFVVADISHGNSFPGVCSLLCGLHRDLVRFASNPVAAIKVNQGRLEIGYLVMQQACIAADNHAVALVGFMCSCTIDRNHTTTRFRLDSIGNKTLTIIQVINMYLLILINFCSSQQVCINRA